MAAVQRAISAPVMPRRKIAISSADICSSATRPWVYASITQSIAASDSTPPSRLARDDRRRVECGLGHGFSGSRRARSSGPNASGSSSPNGRGPDGWSIEQSAGRRAPAAPAGTARTASAARRRRPHRTARSACRHRRNAGRRPPRTRHRDLGHMRHSPHCSRPPFGGRRPAPPRPPGTPNTAHRPCRPPLLPCAATSSSRYRLPRQLRQPGSECIPNPPSRGSTRDVGNPNFEVKHLRTANTVVLWLLQMGLESPAEFGLRFRSER